MHFVELITNLAVEGKYLLLFIVYLIEGPIFGFISAIVASTGALNIYVVAILLISGEIAADLLYYYLGRKISTEKLNRKLSKHEDNGVLNTVKEVLKKHPVRVLIFVKTVAFIAVPSLLLIGRYRALKPIKFLLWTTAICLVKDFLFLFLGYGIGISLESFLKGYDIYRIIAIILAVLALGYILFKTNRDKVEEFTIKKLKDIK